MFAISPQVHEGLDGDVIYNVDRESPCLSNVAGLEAIFCAVAWFYFGSLEIEADYAISQLASYHVGKNNSNPTTY